MHCAPSPDVCWWVLCAWMSLLNLPLNAFRAFINHLLLQNLWCLPKRKSWDFRLLSSWMTYCVSRLYCPLGSICCIRDLDKINREDVLKTWQDWLCWWSLTLLKVSCQHSFFVLTAVVILCKKTMRKHVVHIPQRHSESSSLGLFVKDAGADSCELLWWQIFQRCERRNSSFFWAAPCVAECFCTQCVCVCTRVFIAKVIAASVVLVCSLHRSIFRFWCRACSCLYSWS